MLELVQEQLAKGRRCLVYSTYTDSRDTTSRLQAILKRHGIHATIGFKWEIFDGNEGKTSIKEASINKEILINKKADAERKLKLNLANNQTNYEISNAQISLKDKARSIARTALENVEKEFRYGTKKSSDLIDAETDFQNAELEYKTAIFNQRRNAIELMKSTQSLDLNKL